MRGGSLRGENRYVCSGLVPARGSKKGGSIPCTSRMVAASAAAPVPSPVISRRRTDPPRFRYSTIATAVCGYHGGTARGVDVGSGGC